MSFYLPYGLKGGKLIDISSVTSGLQKDVFCPGCNSPLVARKGKVRQHHFAHYNSIGTVACFETAVHLAAKKVFLSHKKIKLPSIYASFDFIGRVEVLESFVFDEITSVYLEKRIKNFVPDIILEKEGGQLFIEIFVTHKVDDEKRIKIENHGISTIEIDLSWMIDDPINLEELAEFLINDIETKEWVFNKKKKALIEAKKVELADEIAKAKENSQNNIYSAINEKARDNQRQLEILEQLRVDRLKNNDKRFKYFEKIKKGILMNEVYDKNARNYFDKNLVGIFHVRGFQSEEYILEILERKHKL